MRVGNNRQLTLLPPPPLHRWATTPWTRPNQNCPPFATRTSWSGRTTWLLSATCTNLQFCTTSKCDSWSPGSSTHTVVLTGQNLGCQPVAEGACKVRFAPSLSHFLICRYHTGGCKSIQAASYLWRCNHSRLLGPEHGRHGPSYICRGRGGLQTNGQVYKADILKRWVSL